MPRALWISLVAVSLSLPGLARAQELPAESPPPASAPPAPEPTASRIADPGAATPAAAPEPRPPASEATTQAWYQGERGRRRAWRLAAVLGAGLAYLASETVLKGPLTADACRWCAPPSLDESVRDTLRWSDTQEADSLSNLSAYLAAPVLALGLTAVAAASDSGRGESAAARIFDDVLPVVESVAYSQLVVQAVKFSVGRQRPRVRFSDASSEPGTDDNVSFFSGHSALAFSLATSAGVIAHRRGSRLEPMVWALGLGLAGMSAYLRIAADEHYFTDVLTGSAFGVAAGYLTPLLLDRPARARKLVALPTPHGLTLSGEL